MQGVINYTTSSLLLKEFNQQWVTIFYENNVLLQNFQAAPSIWSHIQIATEIENPKSKNTEHHCMYQNCLSTIAKHIDDKGKTKISTTIPTLCHFLASPCYTSTLHKNSNCKCNFVLQLKFQHLHPSYTTIGYWKEENQDFLVTHSNATSQCIYAMTTISWLRSKVLNQIEEPNSNFEYIKQPHRRANLLDIDNLGFWW